MADIERTPEQIRAMIDNVEQALSNDREDLDYRLFENYINSPAFSQEFGDGARTAERVERFQGILDGIRYAIGEGELPDIEKMRLVGDAMAKYLDLSVFNEGSREPNLSDRPPVIEGGS